MRSKDTRAFILGKCFCVKKNLATMMFQDFRNAAKPLCLRRVRPYAGIFGCAAEVLAAPETRGSSILNVLERLGNKR